MPLVKQTVYEFECLDLIFTGSIKLLYRMGMDKIMLNSGKLLSRRHGCAYSHFLIYLTGVAGNHRRSIFERQFDAVVGLAYSCRAQYDHQFSTHPFIVRDDDYSSSSSP